jgi:hypothetical protein
VATSAERRQLSCHLRCTDTSAVLSPPLCCHLSRSPFRFPLVTINTSINTSILPLISRLLFSDIRTILIFSLSLSILFSDIIIFGSYPLILLFSANLFSGITIIDYRSRVLVPAPFGDPDLFFNCIFQALLFQPHCSGIRIAQGSMGWSRLRLSRNFLSPCCTTVSYWAKPGLKTALTFFWILELFFRGFFFRKNLAYIGNFVFTLGKSYIRRRKCLR